MTPVLPLAARFHADVPIDPVVRLGELT